MTEEILIHNKNKKKIESRYMTKKRRKIYTVLEELNFHWDYEEIKEFKEMWNKGVSIFKMIEHFGRTEEEIALLILDRGMKNEIKQRKGGLFGC